MDSINTSTQGGQAELPVRALYRQARGYRSASYLLSKLIKCLFPLPLRKPFPVDKICVEKWNWLRCTSQCAGLPAWCQSRVSLGSTWHSSPP